MFRNRLRPAFAALLLTIALPAAAGPLDKAFKALGVHDYFRAREIFLKQTRKNPAPAWYGLSVIAGRDNNPFYQLDSAHAYIMRADKAYTLTTDRQRAGLAKWGVDHQAIEDQKLHVHTVAWEIAKGRNTIEGYQRYIHVHSQSPFLKEAILVRDHMAFNRAREANTSAAYAKFLKDHPMAREVFEARNRLQEAIYRESTMDKDLGSYLAFIRAHPESPYARNAEDEVFRLSTPLRTVEQYRKFIQEHPTNHRVPDAWRSLYENYTRDLSVGTITRFLQDHPDYPFVEELVDDYRTASLVLLPFRRGEEWGFIDDGGVERIKAEFEWVEPFHGAQALVSRDGRVGTINRMGRSVVPIEYDDVLDPVESTSTVERAGLVGAVDAAGDLVVPMVFSDVGEFSKGIAYASRDDLYGYINARGETVIPFRFTSAGTFRNGLAVVEEDGSFGVIDTKGNMVVPAQYDWVEGFEGTVSRVRRNGKLGIISPFGDELLPVKYDHVGAFRNGLALVVEGRSCGYVGLDGGVRIPLAYESAEGVSNWGDFINGLAEVQQKGKRCLIDTLNTKVFPCQFVDIGPATGPLIPVRKRAKWGFADRRGTVLFDNRYDQAWEMVGGIARVKNGELFGGIDSTGKEVIPLKYKGLVEAGHGFLVATTDEGSGLLDGTGRVVLPMIHDAISVESATIARVERNERFGYVRLADGRFIWKEEGMDPLSE